MKMRRITVAGKPMFEIYDANETWIASFTQEADALLFMAAKRRASFV